jgi:hypothetical protein
MTDPCLRHSTRAVLVGSLRDIPDDVARVARQNVLRPVVVVPGELEYLDVGRVALRRPPDNCSSDVVLVGVTRETSGHSRDRDSRDGLRLLLLAFDHAHLSANLSTSPKGHSADRLTCPQGESTTTHPRSRQPVESSFSPPSGSLLRFWSGLIGDDSRVGGCRESADRVCPCRGPLLDQRLA